MEPFENYFSEEAIIRELCKARIRVAARRHEALFFHNIDRHLPSAESVPLPRSWDVPMDIFPPRRRWHRFRPRIRTHLPRDPNLVALESAVLELRLEEPHAPWAVELQKVVESIQRRAIGPEPFSFKSPEVVPEIKDARAKVFRPLASFPLTDRIVDCITARYFRESLNDALLDACLAFRPKRDGRHDGLNAILDIQKHHAAEALYVAECDIQGFYDCVSHDVARLSVRSLIADAQALDPALLVSPRALAIFEAYLTSYSFLRNVREVAEPELQLRIKGATYGWRDEPLKRLYGEDPVAVINVGVPQGGALSTLIANAVLHQADKAVITSIGDRPVTYLRYCDDMLVLSPDREACADAMRRYEAAVDSLCLPVHEPAALVPYREEEKRSFWKAKSRPVYRWGPPTAEDKGYPWIQFLGYQLRYDGLVRIRPSSIGKERCKLTEISSRLMRSLRKKNLPNIRQTRLSIKHRLRMKLIAVGVGRRDVGQPLDQPLPCCWANGFRWLAGKTVVTSELSHMDQHRERQINRVARRLWKLPISPKTKGTKKDVEHRRFYGFPFSYHGQFGRKR